MIAFVIFTGHSTVEKLKVVIGKVKKTVFVLFQITSITLKYNLNVFTKFSMYGF